MNGAELKRRRLALGFTQEDLARIFGVHQPLISQWETKKYPIRHPGILEYALKFLESNGAKNDRRDSSAESEQ